MRSGRRASAWLVLAAVLGAGLVIAAFPDDTARTSEDRVFEIARTTKCPTCRSQSVAESEAPIAKEIRTVIATRVEAGETDEEIRGALVDRFGEEVQLRPAASGVTGLVWVIPVVVGLVALAGLVLMFRRWKEQPTAHATPEDRELVEEAVSARSAEEQ